MQTTLDIDTDAHPELTIFMTIKCDTQYGPGGFWGADDYGWDRFQWQDGISHGGGTYQTSATQNDNPHIITTILNDGVPNGSFVIVDGTQNLQYTEENAGGTNLICQ